MKRLDHITTWLTDLLCLDYPDGLLPRDLELEATRAGIDWHFWKGCPAVQAMITLEPREAYPGRVLPHYVLRRDDDE